MPAHLTAWLVLFAGVWLLWVVISRVIERNPRGDTLGGIAYLIARIYLRVWHRARFEGQENIPSSIPPGGLIVIANHTAGIDPMLIQIACPFEIRWMMMREMMLPAFDRLWAFLNIIPVGTTGSDAQAARVAIRHVKDGGVLGVFPQGGIERSWKGESLAFQAGVGLIVSRTGASVLVCVIENTPRCNAAWGSFLKPSSGRGARVRFLPIVSYAGQSLDAAAIVADLERRARAR